METRILKVIIRNFQSHKYSEMEFDPYGITVTKGPSDNGKSAILRALRWVITNQPDGDAFISDWVPRTPKGNKAKENTEVEVFTTNGWVKRVKGKVNEYWLKTNDLDEEIKFENFPRTSPPQEIVDFFNFSDINIHEQKNTHFLLDQNGSSVAKYVNEIVDLTKIDSSITAINSAVKKAKSSKASKQETINTLEEQMKAYSEVDKLDTGLKRIENKGNALEKKEVIVDSIVAKNNELKLLQTKKDAAENILLFSSPFKAAQNSFNSLTMRELDYGRLVTLFDSFTNIKDRLVTTKTIIDENRTFNILKEKQKVIDSNNSSLSKIINKSNALKTTRDTIDNNKKIVDINLNRVNNMHKALLKKEEVVTNLESALKTYTDTKDKIAINVKNLSAWNDEYIELRGDSCPTCHRPWDDKEHVHA